MGHTAPPCNSALLLAARPRAMCRRVASSRADSAPFPTKTQHPEASERQGRSPGPQNPDAVSPFALPCLVLLPGPTLENRVGEVEQQAVVVVKPPPPRTFVDRARARAPAPTPPRRRLYVRANPPVRHPGALAVGGGLVDLPRPPGSEAEAGADVGVPATLGAVAAYLDRTRVDRSGPRKRPTYAHRPSKIYDHSVHICVLLV